MSSEPPPPLPPVPAEEATPVVAVSPAGPVVPPRRRRPRVFSLAALMLLVATCGVLSGVVAGARWEAQNVDPDTIAANLVAGALGGLFIGGSLAGTYDLGIGGLLFGIGGGLFLGGAAGALSGLNLDVRIVLAGGAALVGLAAIVRWGSSRRGPSTAPGPVADSPFPDREPRRG